MRYSDLIVWQKAMDLVEGIYRLSRLFPGDERFGLTSQIQRSAVSVPANIAEGHGRKSTGAYLQHLSIACGSLAELETHIQIARRLGYISEDLAGSTLEAIAEIGRMMAGLRTSLNQKQIALQNRAPDRPDGTDY